MQSQIQCPVCTLYLHVGMNLQIHLETHPKDQVIAALVNLTLLQQNTNENDEEVAKFRCSTYSPLTQENVPKQPQTTDTLPKERAIENQPISEAESPAITIARSQISTGSVVSEPITTPKNAQPMIVNSCSTRVIRPEIVPHQIISSSQILNNSIPVSSTNTNTTVATSTPITFTNQQLLPPPPPYDINNSAYKRIINNQQTELPKCSTPNYAAEEPSTHNFFLFSNSIRNISDIRDIRSRNDTTLQSSRTSVDIPENSQHHSTAELIEIDNHIDEDNYAEIDEPENESDDKYTDSIVDEEVPLQNDVIMIDDDEPVYNDELPIVNTLSVVIHSNNLHQPTEPSTSNIIQPVLPNKKRARTKLRILSDVKLDASNAIPITQTIFRNNSFSGTIIDVDSYKPNFDKIQFSSLNSLPLTKREKEFDMPTSIGIEVEDLTDDANARPEDDKPNPNEMSESRRILFSANGDVPECDEVMQSQDDLIKNEFTVDIVYKEEFEMTASANDDQDNDTVIDQQEYTDNEIDNILQPEVPPPPPPPVHVPVISVQTSVIRMASLRIAETRSKTPEIVCPEHNTETSANFTVPTLDINDLPPPPPYAEAVSHSKAIATVTQCNVLETGKLQTTNHSSTELSSSSRTLLKKPFIKTPKKLVVKFKKPFVPVTEEEANLQPPPTDANATAVIEPTDLKIELNDVIQTDNESGIDTDSFDNEQTVTGQTFDCLENVPFSPLRESYTPTICYVPFSPLRESYTPTICYSSPLRDDASNQQQTLESNAMEDNITVEYMPMVLELKNEPGTQTNKEVAENLMTTDNYEKHADQDDVAAPTDDTVGEQQSLIVYNEQISGNESNETTCVEQPFAVENEIAMPLPMAPIVDMKCETWTQPGTSCTTTLATLLNIDTKKEIEVTNITTASEIYTILTANQNCHQPSATSTANMQNSYIDAAGPSRLEYGLSTFLGYNDPVEGEDFYSGVPLSPIGFSPDSYAWNQRFSPPFAPFDNNERNSYMDLDLCKNANSTCDRAPSADSMNIRTDEKMPAKGEISEQESNGDIDGSWSHQVSKLLYTQML